MNQQLTLFDLREFEYYTPIIDSAWDEQDETEPPDPDDYPSVAAYEQAYFDWANKYPELLQHAVAMSACESVGEQVTSATSQGANTNNLVKFPTKKSAPQHEKAHWVEKYWVERSGNKYWYYRYMWMDGRKIHRRYIGSLNSPKARDRKLAIEEAINSGRSPKEIEKLIHSWREEK